MEFQALTATLQVMITLFVQVALSLLTVLRSNVKGPRFNVQNILPCSATIKQNIIPQRTYFHNNHFADIVGCANGSDLKANRTAVSTISMTEYRCSAVWPLKKLAMTELHFLVHFCTCLTLC